MDNVLIIAFFAVFVLIAGRVLLSLFGRKAALFGAPIARTLGEVSAAPRGPVKVAVRVHVLGDPGASPVGLELVARSFAGYRMMPATFSADDARKLASLLEAAANSLASP